MAIRGKPNATGRSSGRATSRRARMMRPPPDEPFVWLTRELLRSAAWQSLGINARRFIDFLLLEHMNHGGAENGRLKAPYRQLEDFGIASRHISRAIRQAIASGLVDRTDSPDDPSPGPIRRPATYRLTWLPTADGEPPTNRWRNYTPTPRRERSLHSQRRADILKLPSEGDADTATPREGTIYISGKETETTGSSCNGVEIRSALPSMPTGHGNAAGRE